MAKKEEKGILGRVVDAVSSRDEKEEAEAAKAEAARATATAARTAAEKRAAEAKARAAEVRAAAAEKEAAEAKSKLEQMKREQARQEAMERVAEIREKVAMAAQKRTYVVKSGDSLSKIAKELLGDANRWPEIFEANRDQIKDPNLIYPGQELKIP